MLVIILKECSRNQDLMQFFGEADENFLYFGIKDIIILL